MLTLRKASDRGLANHGWLKSFHTFLSPATATRVNRVSPICW